MKNLLLLFLVSALLPLTTVAQSLRGLDKSPLDIAYFPDNFAHDRKDGEKAIVKVTYSRPAKNGREVFGQLVPYEKVWRTGANEATEIKVYQTITLGDKKLKPGTYSLFTLPGETEWEIIVNKDLDYWGAYSYEPTRDVLRTKVPAGKSDQAVENFTIQFKLLGTGKAVMILAWDKTIVEVPVSF
ncbi:MAG: DUF2911 domain-containing protein [Bacteroidia bacterium]|nr:DUF2911 domain-containing protein [Bacteroidia bacterium]